MVLVEAGLVYSIDTISGQNRATLTLYKGEYNMMFTNPCKRCLVKPICNKKCDKRYDNINTIESLYSIPSILAVLYLVIVLLSWK